MAFVFKKIEKDGEEIISHPTVELYEHTVMKGAQAGAVLPILFSPPLMYAFNRKITWNELVQRTAKYSLRGSIIGAVLLIPMTYMRIREQSDVQIYDRSYRIRYNKLQVRCDRISTVTAGVGAIAGVMGWPALGPLTAGLYGASLGLGLGVFLHVVITRVI